MKIHNSQPEKVIRLMITKTGEKTECLTLSECTQIEVTEWLKVIFSNASPFCSGKRTTIQVREAIGANNGKSVSIAFYGMNPCEVKKHIENNLKTP